MIAALLGERGQAKRIGFEEMGIVWPAGLK
jgi:hypothetical protein